MENKKLYSGRFWFTIIAALVFAYCSVVGILEAGAVREIIIMILAFYFGRVDRKESNENN